MRVALVEDDAMLRNSMKILLGGEAGLQLVGAWGSAEEALGAMAAARPEVVLADLGLPGLGGVEMIRRLKEAQPDLELIVLTVFEERAKVVSALRAGATGYLLKASSPREIVEAIHCVHQGGAPMTPKIARALISEFRDPDLPEPELLTAREREILADVEKGLLYKEIGAAHGISEHTVHSHVKKIYSKLQARDRRQALAVARQRGLL